MDNTNLMNSLKLRNRNNKLAYSINKDNSKHKFIILNSNSVNNINSIHKKNKRLKRNNNPDEEQIKLLNMKRCFNHSIENIMEIELKHKSDCIICLEKIDNPFYLSCGHIFHENCAYDWLLTNPKCPVCKGCMAHFRKTTKILFESIKNDKNILFLNFIINMSISILLCYFFVKVFY